MVWVRIDDGFADHPKIVRVGDAGLAMFVRGLCYCNRHLTDGRIPEAAAKLLGSARTAAALVTAGLWAKDSDSYVVHDYAEFNPRRDEVLKDRAAAAARKERWKERRAEQRRNGVPNAGGNGEGTGPPPPYPPPPPGSLRSPRGRGARGALAPEGAAPATERIAAAVTTACRVGIQEARAREAIDAHGLEAVERANVAGLKPPIRLDAVGAWFDSLKS